MLLWFKKLVKSRWFVDYVCSECENHYCGSCGRGVAEGNWFYTKRAAMADAENWVRETLGDTEDPNYEFAIEYEGDQTNVLFYYNNDGKKTVCNLYATVSPRKYW
jgi:hypothetical protein